MAEVSTTSRSIRIASLGQALSLFIAISYLLCIAFGLLAPAKFHMHEAWAPLLPGFEWLTLSGFIFGLIGSYLYGWYIAIVFVPLYRFFKRRQQSS
ncbi:MAG: DUF5676 family membrane protein [Pseudomonadota bacterium]